ncbi:MAG: tail fiber domain-containing protein [Phycisphaerae bacterium]|jgi:hypothetical protein
MTLRIGQAQRLCILLALAAAAPLTAQTPPGMAVTYQGLLKGSGAPAEGPHDMVFRLYNAVSGGNQIGPTLIFDGSHGNPPPVQVTGGLFSVQLDFGALAYNGEDRWLEITVEGTTLAPRQRLTAAPYALALPGLAAGPGTFVDQAQDAHTLNYSSPGWQSFTAGVDGELRAVDVGRSFSSSQSVTFQIRAGTGYGGQVLATQASFVPAGSGLHRVYFDPPPTLVKAQVYTLTYTAPFIINSWWLASGNPYPNGQFHLSLSEDYDLHFRTIMFGPAAGLAMDRDLAIAGNCTVSGLASIANRVGVGTAAPTMSLEVSGPISHYGKPALGVSNGAGGEYLYLHSAPNPSLIWPRTGALRFGSELEPGSDYVELMRINGNGTVGIGTTTPGSFRLAVNGDAAKPGGGSWSAFSDSRLKRDIAPLSGTLDRLLSLRGYTFEYAPEAVEKRLAAPGRQMGLLAEEVERVFPDWVERDADGYRYVTERATTALLVEALRDLRAEKDRQIAERDAQLAELRREQAELRARLDRIEADRSRPDDPGGKKRP